MYQPDHQNHQIQIENKIENKTINYKLHIPRVKIKLTMETIHEE